MGLKVHASREDLDNYLEDPSYYERNQDIKPTNKDPKKPSQGINLELNQNTLMWIGIIVALILLLKIDFPKGQSSEPLQLNNRDGQAVIAGQVVSKVFKGGILRIILDDPYHNTQYTLLVSPDITDPGRILPGTRLQVKCQQIGPNEYVLNRERDIRELTQIVDYHVLTNVRVIHGIANFQMGEQVSKLRIPDIPDGHYHQLLLAVDSDQHIQVIRATQ